MPNFGQVNNPAGANGYVLPGGGESPYGTVKRLAQETRGLPAAPGANAPRQAKRAAANGTQPEPAPVTPDQVIAGAPALPYPVMLANAWAAVAATPGASPLVQMIAEQAQRGV